MDQVSVIHLHISILWLNMPMCLYKRSDWSMSGCDKVFAWVLHPFQVRCHVYLQTVRLKKWVLDIYFLGNALGFFWTIGITWKNDKSWLQGGCHWFQHARPHLHPVPRYWPSWLRWFSLCRSFKPLDHVELFSGKMAVTVAEMQDLGYSSIAIRLVIYSYISLNLTNVVPHWQPKQ